MIGLLFIYFIGKAFYDLAELHGKSRWGFAILGVASYYVGTFVGGILIFFVYEWGMSKSLEGVGDVALGFMALPAGVLSCWGTYRLLRSQWSNRTTFTASEEILDADLIDREQH